MRASVTSGGRIVHALGVGIQRTHQAPFDARRVHQHRYHGRRQYAQFDYERGEGQVVQSPMCSAGSQVEHEVSRKFDVFFFFPGRTSLSSQASAFCVSVCYPHLDDRSVDSKHYVHSYYAFAPVTGG